MSTTTVRGVTLRAEEWPDLRELSAADSQAVFHAVMEAFTRPGTRHVLPDAAIPEGVPAVVLPLLALADLMTPVAALPCCAHGALTAGALAPLARLTGAPIVDPAAARFALALRKPLDWSALNRGSHWSPEQGAMLIQRVEGLDGGHAWRLSGPGIETEATLAPQGLDAAWLAQRNVLTADYPAGVDVLLVTDAGEIAALSRTTKAELR